MAESFNWILDSPKKNSNSSPTNSDELNKAFFLSQDTVANTPEKGPEETVDPTNTKTFDHLKATYNVKLISGPKGQQMTFQYDHRLTVFLTSEKTTILQDRKVTQTEVFEVIVEDQITKIQESQRSVSLSEGITQALAGVTKQLTHCPHQHKLQNQLVNGQCHFCACKLSGGKGFYCILCEYALCNNCGKKLDYLFVNY